MVRQQTAPPLKVHVNLRLGRLAIKLSARHSGPGGKRYSEMLAAVLSDLQLRKERLELSACRDRARQIRHFSLNNLELGAEPVHVALDILGFQLAKNSVDHRADDGRLQYIARKGL